ncbi:alpha/beta hydrolase [Pantoea sp. EA-12]|uniref:alpha/beta fold hydrolase n=1 Tax=Pantoea sp. EA-12 TaxID=3043303 RepID=UPI0024B572D2|nr:alpha/beta hydrolase [Pantoea sp. EA-12]MDI9221495.1 alpha/beta hydrolase [Pantoea sp. EA-12]
MKKIVRQSLLAALVLTATTSAFAATSTETDYVAAFNTIHQVKAGVLNVGYVDIGPRDGQAVILLHGWPYDIQSYANVAPQLAAKGYRVIVPYLRGYGSTHFLSDKTPRNGQPSALAADTVALMDALGIKQAVFGGFDWGARTADIVAALWPERVKALVSVSGYLISSQDVGRKALPPQAELQWWYQFYFATERGAQGYAKNTHDFAKLIWQQASPGWKFSDATFNVSAKALDNPDQVAVTLSNYRWRLGMEKGEQKYDAYERKLATLPVINVPTITIEGDNNGAPHPAPQAYRAKFSGKYEHRTFTGNIGHNPPAEDPQDFVKAVVDAAAL